ncbi:hypothetical protein IH970_05660 [candidate division KSB1 bacterium]|nr:hypothetical protein [candidate division KSB1 bacterium]
MIDSKTEDLINRDIDGVLSAQETNRLKEHLSTDSEAQNYYDEIENLSQMLAQVEEVNPGPNLKKNILNSIPVQKYQNEENRERTPLFSAWNFRPSYRLTLAFAIGLIIGFFTYSFVTDLPPNNNNSNLIGTILLNGSDAKFRPADQAEITLPEINGTVSTQYAENVVLFRIDLTTDSEIEVVVEFDGNDLRFAGFQPQKYSAGQINVSSNEIKLVNKGRHDYVLVFEDKTSTVSKFTIKVFSNKLLYEKTLTTRKASRE